MAQPGEAWLAPTRPGKAGPGLAWSRLGQAWQGFARPPRPAVVTVSRTKPTMMVFFDPSQFLIMPFTGAKMIWAIENMARMMAVSF